MRADHVSLYPVQTKIPPRVFKRASGVGKSVKSVGFVGRVPIVQEIVVKKRASDEGACVMPEGEPFGYVDAERCHKKGVRVYAESAVLYIFFFFLDFFLAFFADFDAVTRDVSVKVSRWFFSSNVKLMTAYRMRPKSSCLTDPRETFCNLSGLLFHFFPFI